MMWPLRYTICLRRSQSTTPSSPPFSLLRPQSNTLSRNALVSPRPSSTRYRRPSATGTWIDRSPLSTTWPCCALARNGGLEKGVERGRMILRQAPPTTAPTWLSNRNARIPTPPSDVDSHSNASLSNVCTVLATPRCRCANDNMSSVVSIRCSATSTGIIASSRANTAYSPTMNALSSRLTASCISKVM